MSTVPCNFQHYGYSESSMCYDSHHFKAFRNNKKCFCIANSNFIEHLSCPVHFVGIIPSGDNLMRLCIPMHGDTRGGECKNRKSGIIASYGINSPFITSVRYVGFFWWMS